MSHIPPPGRSDRALTPVPYPPAVVCPPRPRCSRCGPLSLDALCRTTPHRRAPGPTARETSSDELTPTQIQRTEVSPECGWQPAQEGRPPAHAQGSNAKRQPWAEQSLCAVHAHGTHPHYGSHELAQRACGVVDGVAILRLDLEERVPRADGNMMKRKNGHKTCQRKASTEVRPDPISHASNGGCGWPCGAMGAISPFHTSTSENIADSHGKGRLPRENSTGSRRLAGLSGPQPPYPIRIGGFPSGNPPTS